ncbi:MAG: arylsulfatase [Phycisphaerales bacterium]|nr:arylsulfatase [Phycisphaerales bacterium]
MLSFGAAALLTAAVLGSPVSSAHAQTPVSKPNVVLILVDDLGFSDLGCYGGEINTPNLDRLANGGIKFKQFYNTARCCPTRACILTGLYPHQAGVGDMVDTGANTKLGGPAYTAQLNNSCVTIAEALKPAGYKTLMSGKWHVGSKRPHWPIDRGFDQSFVLTSGAMNYFGFNYHDPPIAPGEWKIPPLYLNDQPYKIIENFFATDAFADNANTMIKDAVVEKKPFFLYLTFTAPHFPLQATPEAIARQKGKYTQGWEQLRAQRHKRQIDLGLIDPKWNMEPIDPRVPNWSSLTPAQKQDWELRMEVYAALVENLDENVGKVMTTLKTQGIEQNTLVMFMSDNGGAAEPINRGIPGSKTGSRESWHGYHMGWASASNTPFRMHKIRNHEGGISSPFIAYWPGTIKPNTTSNQVGHVIDMMPTILEAAGASYPKEHNGHAITPVEGKSLLPILKGTDKPVHDVLFWEHEGNKAVREIGGGGDLKLVQYFEGQWELYDMSIDRTEMHDLSKSRPADAKRLSAAWQAWADRVHVRDWALTKQP